MTPPPDPAAVRALNPFPLAAGTELHRTHAVAFRPGQFNPGRGLPTRFAPFADVTGNTVPTLYAATTREAAAFESIFHDIDPTARFKTVRMDVVTSRAVSRILPQRDLSLGALFAPDLKAIGLARNDLIETSKATYRQTALWAQAIHHWRPELDGLIWTSRQCDPAMCVVLFGDRVAESDLQVIERLDVGARADLLLEIRSFGRRAGITLTT